jgi:hypothetical protein
LVGQSADALIREVQEEDAAVATGQAHVGHSKTMRKMESVTDGPRGNMALGDAEEKLMASLAFVKKKHDVEAIQQQHARELEDQVIRKATRDAKQEMRTLAAAVASPERAWVHAQWGDEVALACPADKVDSEELRLILYAQMNQKDSTSVALGEMHEASDPTWIPPSFEKIGETSVSLSEVPPSSRPDHHRRFRPCSDADAQGAARASSLRPDGEWVVVEGPATLTCAFVDPCPVLGLTLGEIDLLVTRYAGETTIMSLVDDSASKGITVLFVCRCACSFFPGFEKQNKKTIQSASMVFFSLTFLD